MVNSRRDAAYHEASHFVRAGTIDASLLTKCVVTENEDGWGGDAGIDPESIPLAQRSYVALVGFLGEGRAKTNSYRPSKLVFSEFLLDSVLECVQALNGVENGWEVVAPMEGVPDVFGQLSRPDLLTIPLQFRSEPHIRAGLKNAIDFLNAVWMPIDLIGSYLLTHDSFEATGFTRHLIQREFENNFSGAK